VDTLRTESAITTEQFLFSWKNRICPIAEITIKKYHLAKIDSTILRLSGIYLIKTDLGLLLLTHYKPVSW
jgi:hypothetical protein